MNFKRLVCSFVFLATIPTEAIARDCYEGGVTTRNGQSRVFYRKEYIPLSWGGSCAPYSRVRVCRNGALSGGEPYVKTGERFIHTACVSPINSLQPVASTQSQWRITYHDEFLTPNRLWARENGPMWLGGYRVPEKALIEGGKLRILNRRGIRTPSPATPTFSTTLNKTIYPSQNESAHLISKKEFTYGLFEARVKLAAGPSIDNAFWLMNNRGSEIDIFEAFFINDKKFKVTTNLHPRRPTSFEPFLKPRPSGLNGATLLEGTQAKQFHVYSLLWEPDKIVWYIDGKEVRRETRREVLEAFVGVPLKIRFSTAVTNAFSNYGGGAIDSRSTNSEMVVDYVRVFQRK